VRRDWLVGAISPLGILVLVASVQSEVAYLLQRRLHAELLPPNAQFNFKIRYVQVRFQIREDLRETDLI
jgi:hypothetical protein